MVVGAVVGALDLRDLWATRMRARDLDGRHHRFRATTDEPDLLEDRRPLADLLGEQHLALRGQAEGRARRRTIGDGLHDLRMGVTMD